MRKSLTTLALAISVAALAGCGENAQEGNSGQSAEKPAGKDGVNQTIAAGLDKNSRFFAAAKAAGLDATLGGREPYTVLVPDDAAFGKLPAGTTENWLKPESRAQLTTVLTYHILPGTVLAADIGKTIDNAKGKAMLATVGGETLIATREDGKIVLTDSAGGKATITKADELRSNGVVHHIDGVLMPANRGAQQQGTAAPAG